MVLHTRSCSVCADILTKSSSQVERLKSHGHKQLNNSIKVVDFVGELLAPQRMMIGDYMLVRSTS